MSRWPTTRSSTASPRNSKRSLSDPPSPGCSLDHELWRSAVSRRPRSRKRYPRSSWSRSRSRASLMRAVIASTEVELRRERFGKYHVLERIAQGGMAEVYKVKTVGIAGFEKIQALKRILD